MNGPGVTGVRCFLNLVIEHSIPNLRKIGHKNLEHISLGVSLSVV